MMLEFLKDNAIEKSDLDKEFHTYEDFNSPDFKRKLSDHLLGEIKDQISFYYNDDDYELFLKFFELLNGNTRFSYDEYVETHTTLLEFIKTDEKSIPNFMGTASQFLQFLYELNVLCYVEDVEGHKPLIHWSFRDRSFSNLSPKVKEDVRYEIFYGLTRAVNTGRKRVR